MRLTKGTAETGDVWVHGSNADYDEGQRALPPPGEVLDDEGVYALASSRVATLDVDGVVAVPGRDVLRRDRGCYWVTGVVSSPIRPMGSTRTSVTQEFLLVAGNARLVARTTLKRRDRLGVGERCTVECIFELVASHDWSAFDLPGEWAGDWRVQQVIQPGTSPGWDLVLDLAAVSQHV